MNSIEIHHRGTGVWSDPAEKQERRTGGRGMPVHLSRPVPWPCRRQTV